MTKAHRTGLIAFGAVFVLLFAWIAVAEGLGKPSVPSDDVAVVEEVPDGLGNITRADYQVAFRQAWKRAGLNQAPKEGDAQYETARDGAMNDLLDQAWLSGEAAELGVSASEREVENELASIKDTQFPDEKAFRDFLKESGFTEEQVLERVRLQVLSRKIEEQVRTDAPKPTDSEIEDFYDASIDQYTTPESREIRLIVTSDEKDTAAVERALAKDDSDRAFARLARKFSVDPSKSEGGTTTATEGAYPDPAGAAIMDAAEGAVEGPIDVDGNDYFFRVLEVTEEDVAPLSEVRNQIQQQLAPALEQQALTSFIEDYNAKWTSRTVCADGFVISRCSNFKGDGRNPAADPACFEAREEGGDPEEEAALACPSPVALTSPIEPGSNADIGPTGELTIQPKQQGPTPPAGTEPPPPAAPTSGFPTG
ncbi:MAG: peptidyl-prolyl cis-trans isomerase [Solirubrobacterales bacterium]|jgi:foldase protein PrsA